MILSIVIATFNRSSLLQKNISRLRDIITLFDPVEIVVIDDGSHSFHRRKNQKTCQKFHIIYYELKNNKGPAHARNRGITLTKGDWIAFMDDDVVADIQWYKTLLPYMIQNTEGVVGIEGATYASGTGLWDREVENRKGGLFLTSNIIYRKKELSQCHGFDEHFSGPYAEDHELAIRINKWGAIVFVKECIVHHQPRQVNPFMYVWQSFSRIRSLLDAEYYFYTKHKDRYHTLRHAPTFWHGLFTMAWKHWYITLKRRSVFAYIQHPLQGFCLIASVCLEQISLWPLILTYIHTFHKSWRRDTMVKFNTKQTAILWHFEQKHCNLLAFQPSFFRSVFFRWRKTPVYSCEPILYKTKVVSKLSAPKFYVRIDDFFLDQHDIVQKFCRCMEKKSIPFLAAIPGESFKKNNHISLMQHIRNVGGELALHGYTHTGKFGPYDSEILQMNFTELATLFNPSQSILYPRLFRPFIFVPPFNAISWEQIEYLSEFFPVICGGPETARFSNYLFGPVILNNGSCYFPSFYPFYGDSDTMLNTHTMQVLKNARAPLCLTFHLDREAQDGFHSLMVLLEQCIDRVYDWKTLYHPMRNDCVNVPRN